METITYLGKKALSLKEVEDAGRFRNSLIKIKMPLVFAPMSYGSVNLNFQLALARVAKKKGLLWYSGEGGLHRSCIRTRSCCAAGSLRPVWGQPRIRQQEGLPD